MERHAESIYLLRCAVPLAHDPYSRQSRPAILPFNDSRPRGQCTKMSFAPATTLDYNCSWEALLRPEDQPFCALRADGVRVHRDAAKASAQMERAVAEAPQQSEAALGAAPVSLAADADAAKNARAERAQRRIERWQGGGGRTGPGAAGARGLEGAAGDVDCAAIDARIRRVFATTQRKDGADKEELRRRVRMKKRAGEHYFLRQLTKEFARPEKGEGG